MKHVLIIFGFVLALCCPSLSAATMVLVENGVARADIVVARDASERVKEAASTLAVYLEKSTGAPFAVVESPGKPAALWVGASPEVDGLQLDRAGLDPEGFLLQGVAPAHYVILGGSDRGTEYGVYDFLERYVGVRWLMPTEMGEDVPRHRTLEVPDTRIVENPAFLQRHFFPLQPEGESADSPFPRYAQWARRNRVNESGGRMNSHHNLKAVFPPSIYGKKNPEFYPLVDAARIPPDFAAESPEFRRDIAGQRYLPKDDRDERWNPNFSAPGAVDAAAAEIIAYFDRNPAAACYSLGINDSGNFDQSEESRKRRSGRTNSLGLEDISDDYFLWANAVVEKVLKVHPDKWFGMLAYDQLADPPSAVPVHPRIVPFLTYERLYWIDPELRAHNQAIQQRWMEKAEVLGWYDYIYGLMYMLPRFYPHQTQETLQWGLKHKVRYYVAELFPNWGEGPKAWIQAKLLWNPNVDVDALFADWCRRAVGEAGAPFLQKYYRLWENYWTRAITQTDFWKKSYGVDRFQRQYLSYNDLGYLGSAAPGDIEKSDQFIVAMLKAPMTAEQKERAEVITLAWQFYKESYLAYQGKVLSDTLDFQSEKDVLRGLDYAPIAVAANKKRKEILKSFHEQPLLRDVALRVNNLSGLGGLSGAGGNVSWGDDLILKAGSLSRKNRAVANKLEALAQDGDRSVKQLAKRALAESSAP